MIGTKADYARHRRVTTAAISHHLRSGRLTPALTADGRVDFLEADRILGAVLDPGIGGDRRSPAADLDNDDVPDMPSISTPTLALERQGLLRAQREKAELELARLRGELVPLTGFQRFARDLALGVAAVLEARRGPLVDAILRSGGPAAALAAAERQDLEARRELGRRLGAVAVRLGAEREEACADDLAELERRLGERVAA